MATKHSKCHVKAAPVTLEGATPAWEEACSLDPVAQPPGGHPGLGGPARPRGSCAWLTRPVRGELKALLAEKPGRRPGLEPVTALSGPGSLSVREGSGQVVCSVVAPDAAPSPQQSFLLLPGKPVSGLQGNGASEPQRECAGDAGINSPPWQPLETALLPPSVPPLQRGRSRLLSLPQLHASAGPGSQMDASPTSALTTP